jgi:hypothetical protein
MHKTREGASTCVLSSACHASDAALLSLFFSIGVAPHSAIAFGSNTAADPIAFLTERSIARPTLPEPEPPRV